MLHSEKDHQNEGLILPYHIGQTSLRAKASLVLCKLLDLAEVFLSSI